MGEHQLEKDKASSGEVYIANYLSNNNILYIPQYKIDECRNKNPLPFDFGIIDENEKLLGLIEFQGKQHYEPIDYFGGQENFES